VGVWQPDGWITQSQSHNHGTQSNFGTCWEVSQIWKCKSKTWGIPSPSKLGLKTTYFGHFSTSSQLNGEYLPKEHGMQNRKIYRPIFSHLWIKVSDILWGCREPFVVLFYRKFCILHHCITTFAHANWAEMAKQFLSPQFFGEGAKLLRHSTSQISPYQLAQFDWLPFGELLCANVLSLPEYKIYGVWAKWRQF